jgi:hypothetical protein
MARKGADEVSICGCFAAISRTLSAGVWRQMVVVLALSPAPTLPPRFPSVGARECFASPRPHHTGEGKGCMVV